MTHPITKRMHASRAALPDYSAEIREDLEACRALLLDKGWCRGSMAIRIVGCAELTCSPHDEDACKFCLLGALARVCKGARNFRALAALDRVIAAREPNATGELHTIQFNDTHTKDEVVSLLGDVIESVAA